MKAEYSKNITVLPSQVDAYGRMSHAQIFDLFMDVATEAAEALGVGLAFLRRQGLFWITVKTRVEFLDRPRLLDAVEVSTWPEPPAEMRCNRHYEIRRGGDVLVRGKTEWAIVSAMTRRPQSLEGIMPPGLEYPDTRACPEPFPMIDEGFPDAPFAAHRVTARDIDMAFHMNNVAYVRAIIDAFTVEQWRAMDVRRMDVVFRASAHEGDELLLQKRADGEATDIRGSLPDGRTIVMARLICGNGKASPAQGPL